MGIPNIRREALVTTVFLDGRHRWRRKRISSRNARSLSDYSSIAIDALLFDRPLALWCEDLETYTHLRPLPTLTFATHFGWALKMSLPELLYWIARAARILIPLPPLRWTALHVVAQFSTDIRGRRRRPRARSRARTVEKPIFCVNTLPNKAASGHLTDIDPTLIIRCLARVLVSTAS